MFSYLPQLVKENIFSKVRYVDLIEASFVSQEWWALSMAAFNRNLKNDDVFLWSQVKLCNEMMAKEAGEEWTWWMMMEFTKSKSIEVTRTGLTELQRLTQYYNENGIDVRKLVWKGQWLSGMNPTESFPHLNYLDISRARSIRGFVLSDTISHLQLKDITFEGVVYLSNLILVPDCIKSLSFRNCKGLVFDVVKFESLEYLRLNTGVTPIIDVLEVFLGGSKRLKSLCLEKGLIDKRWLGLFPSNVQRIKLLNMTLDEDTKASFGPRMTFLERKLMAFISQDWTKLRLFKSVSLQSLNNGNHVDYICQPQALEEEISVQMYTDGKLIGLLDSGLLKLVRLSYTLINVHSPTFRQHGNLAPRVDFLRSVPKSVKYLELHLIEFENTNLASFFEDPSCLETFWINANNGLRRSIQDSSFPVAKTLRSLKIYDVKHVQLESILNNCPSLKQLSLGTPEAFTFSLLSKKLMFSSLKLLELSKISDSMVDVLRLFPGLEEIFLHDIKIENLSEADMKALESLKFVRFEIENELISSEAFQCLTGLQFSHLVLGLKKPQGLLCIMGQEKWFLKRFFGRPEDEFTRQVFKMIDICKYESFYFRGLPGRLMEQYRNFTHDLNQFVLGLPIIQK